MARMQLQDWDPRMTRSSFVTVSEAAEMLGGLRPRTVRDAIRDGRLTAYRPVFGREALLLRSDVIRLAGARGAAA